MAAAYKNFKHATPIQIRFADLDGLNHVNNAVYLTYVELARISYLRESVWAEVDLSNLSFILAGASLDFILPVFLEDDIKVYTRCSKIGNKSFELEHLFVRTKADNLQEVAKAKSVLVAYDYKAEKSIVIPDEWREKIEAFEA